MVEHDHVAPDRMVELPERDIDNDQGQNHGNRKGRGRKH
jgi:hypothetical protein